MSTLDRNAFNNCISQFVKTLLCVTHAVFEVLMTMHPRPDVPSTLSQHMISRGQASRGQNSLPSVGHKAWSLIKADNYLSWSWPHGLSWGILNGPPWSTTSLALQWYTNHDTLWCTWPFTWRNAWLHLRHNTLRFLRLNSKPCTGNAHGPSWGTTHNAWSVFKGTTHGTLGEIHGPSMRT